MAATATDPYEALGVARDASDDDIRAAYRRLARRYHPDVNKDPGADDRFKEVSQAYDTLRDPEKRAAYDRGPDLGGFGGGGGGGGGFRGGEGFPGGGGFGGFETGGGEDFGDIFESLFGGGRGRSRAGGRRAGGGFDGFSMRGGDHEATIELTLEEAFRGGRRKFTFTDGREYDVTIPAGVRDGQRIRLAGEGEPGTGGGPAGDLLLRVRIRPHPRFRVVGDDLETDLAVAPWEAALGASVPLRTIDGATIRVNVAPGSSSGRRLRLRGEGWPKRDGGRGDLFAVVKIMVPKTLTPEEREHFEALARVSSFDPRAEG
jgi:curved DNA-binding protein